MVDVRIVLHSSGNVLILLPVVERAGSKRVLTVDGIERKTEVTVDSSSTITSVAWHLNPACHIISLQYCIHALNLLERV